MDVIFLGTGTSQGVPMIACDCTVCTSADPRNRRITVVIPVEQSESKTEVIGEAAPIPVDSLERSP